MSGVASTPLTLDNSNLITDSNSYGTGYPGNTPFPDIIMATAPFDSNGATMESFAVNSQTIEDMLSDQASQILPLYTPGVLNVILFQEGGNSIYYNGSVSEAIDSLTTYCNNATAVGFKIIVSTMIHRNQSTAFGDNATVYNTKLDSFNTALLALTGVYDGCIRPDLESIFASYGAGGYDGDQVHPSQTGQNKYAELYAAAIEALV